MEFEVKQGEIQKLKIENKLDKVEINNLRKAFDGAESLLKCGKV